MSPFEMDELPDELKISMIAKYMLDVENKLERDALVGNLQQQLK